jgi:hypothetical protein
LSETRENFSFPITFLRNERKVATAFGFIKQPSKAHKCHHLLTLPDYWFGSLFEFSV